MCPAPERYVAQIILNIMIVIYTSNGIEELQLISKQEIVAGEDIYKIINKQKKE